MCSMLMSLSLMTLTTRTAHSGDSTLSTRRTVGTDARLRGDFDTEPAVHPQFDSASSRTSSNRLGPAGDQRGYGYTHDQWFLHDLHLQRRNLVSLGAKRLD